MTPEEYEKAKKDAAILALKITEMLHGLPLWLAFEVIEKHVPEQLRAGHVVDKDTQQFSTMRECVLLNAR